MACEAGAVHNEFDVIRAVGLLEPGAEEHAKGAEAIDGVVVIGDIGGPFFFWEFLSNDLWGCLLWVPIF